MALKTDISIDEIGLQLEGAYIALREFVWKGGAHAEVSLDIWASIEAKTLGKLPIKRLRYEIPIPLEDQQSTMTLAYNQVRSLVYTWVKQNVLTTARDV
ncbi:MAG: hypothetical protein HXY43_21650 [Fischerella sp.]|jgi:hypothetical protein|uniref:hypothetical protein n=1 Tax=Fischerella sp. TaxID=1191 RepID=UPI0017AC940A|nr:hypothetical protein [Fischerella sp.]NWF61789.1 hypothetical protein [Fischerella sp.]